MKEFAPVVQEPEVDVCLLGLGVAGGILAAELATAGHSVIGIEKGPYWDYETDFSQTKYDEWGVMIMRKFDHPLRMFTYTLRNDSGQFALPMRRYTMEQYIAAGHGVGGMAQHYAGLMGRFGPWVYQMRSETMSRYGDAFLQSVDPTNDIIDWPMTYSEMDPYYVQWERAWGITGTNQGPYQPMSQDFPLPPHPYSNVSDLMLPALESMGYHPYPTPTALASQPYMNQYGVASNACVYDGWCGEPCNFVCEVGAKANTAFRTIPAAIRTGNFQMVLNSFVFRLDVDPTTKKVTSARYYDPQGNVHVQPAKVFYNGLWGFNLVRLMQLSGIGNPYDPSQVSGSLGRGTQYGVPPPNVASVTGRSPVGGNLYPAGNAEGGGIDILDLADDNFDHAGLNFIGGGMLRAGVYPGAGPSNLTIAAASGPTTMGSVYKASLKGYYYSKALPVTLSMDGPELPDTRWNIDLDPHYTDVYGDPLARWTYNFGTNAYNCATYLSGSRKSPAAQILEKMGCTAVTPSLGVGAGDMPMEAWPAHVRGGCRMGADPSTSVLNKYGQAWTCENLFAGGEITDSNGDNTTIGGTHPMGASLYLHAEGVREYLQSPGPLVS